MAPCTVHIYLSEDKEENLLFLGVGSMLQLLAGAPSSRTSMQSFQVAKGAADLDPPSAPQIYSVLLLIC